MNKRSLTDSTVGVFPTLSIIIDPEEYIMEHDFMPLTIKGPSFCDSYFNKVLILLPSSRKGSVQVTKIMTAPSEDFMHSSAYPIPTIAYFAKLHKINL